MYRYIVILFLLLTSVQVHAEKLSVDQWRKEFYALSKDEAFLAKSNPYPAGSKHFFIHRDYQREVFQNDKLIEKLVTSVESQQGLVKDIRAFTLAIMEDVTSSGIRKLSDGDKERLIDFLLKMMLAANDQQCADYFRGSDNAKNSTYSLLLKMPASDVTQYYRLIQNSINAELNDASDTLLTEAQKTVVTDALGEVLAKLYSTENIKKYVAIAQNPSSYGNADVCWFGSVSLYNVLQLKGDIRKWAVRYWFSP